MKIVRLFEKKNKSNVTTKNDSQKSAIGILHRILLEDNRVVGKVVIVNWIGTIQEGINLYAICPHNLG